jgi:geranylgeranyl pyrophosphate synthase
VAAQVQVILQKQGQIGFQIARATMLTEERLSEPLIGVLRYFIEETWHNIKHPSLISLACEAVGGKSQMTAGVSAAIVLLTGAADIHDDIMDKSKTKAAKPTAYGKFSKDIVLLAGDALLFKGLLQLHKACEEFTVEKKHAILGLVESAFFEIGNATAKERVLKGETSLNPEKYRSLIEAKGSVSEACARIGGIIGQGTIEEIDVLGHFGRTLGFLMTLKNEFADLQDPQELLHRAKNEVLPLPLLYAFQDKSVKKEVQDLLKSRLTKQRMARIFAVTMKTKQVQQLKIEMGDLARTEEKLLKAVEGNTEPFKLLLKLSMNEN